MSSLKPALRLGQTQQLTLTPQLRQSIRMLALSTAELELELSEAAESNPLLEYLAPGEAVPEVGDRAASNDRESGSDADSRDGAGASDAAADDWPTDARDREVDSSDDFGAAGASDVGGLDGEGDYAQNESLKFDDAAGFADESSGGAAGSDEPERAADPDWSDAGAGLRSRGDSGESSWEERMVATVGLSEHLLAQIELLPCSPRDRVIAAVVVDALDDDGILRTPDSEVSAACGLDPPVEASEIDSVRHRLQRLDPTGVASRSMVECLDVQLGELVDVAADEIDLARRLLHDAAGNIGRVPMDRVARQLRCDGMALEGALARLRRLDPKPGLRFNGARTDYVQPDVIAFRQAGRWQVRLNGAAHPGLALNTQYARMAQSASGATERYLRGRLQEARWLIRSVAARGDTLLRVAGWIVREQSAFLDFGAQAMRPLTLREVGGALELHESTVSRATARKYLATPRGVFELRHFFSAALETETGGTASALAVQALIRKLIGAEDARHPRSDAALAKLLAAEGIAVARRTVAKYREGMRIPSSSERCRHG